MVLGILLLLVSLLQILSWPMAQFYVCRKIKDVV